MAVRNVEWKLPYTWGKAITVDGNTKVISLNLRDENNLIIYDQLDDEIYVDLQLPDWIRPQYAFPVGVTTGRVLSGNDWDVTWTILVAKTTSWDVIKLLYWDDGKLYIDNGTGIFKQVYLKPEVDALLATKQDKLIAWENIVIAPDWKTISAIMPAMDRFLSLWDCSTGEPLSFHGSIPFEYKTWDHYLVETVDSTTNYRPSWNAYDGTASQVVETEEVAVWDVYIYDGAVWLLQINHSKSVSFANIAWQPSDNPALDAALDAKANASDVNTKTFTLASTTDYTNAQAAYDYLQDWWNPIIDYDGTIYTYWRTVAGGRSMGFRSSRVNSSVASGNSKSEITIDYITINTDLNYQVNSIIVWDWVTMSSYLDTDVDYQTPYTPTYNGSPATKKYVDDSVGAVDEFEPGNAWTTWQVLKKTANGYEWANETPGWVTSVNGQTWAVTVDEFEPESAWTTWQVLKKTATGYDWANGGWGGGWIQLSPDSPLQLDYLWAGYEDDYANVSTYGDTTAYLVIEWNNPWSWWQPTADTLGYYPLNSTDTNTDQSGNSRDLVTSYGTVRYWTHHWVDCAAFDVWELRTSVFTGVVFNGKLTTSIWYYQDATPNNDNWTIMWAREDDNGPEFGPIVANGWPDGKYWVCGYATGYNATNTTAATQLTNWWHHICQTYDNWTHTIYIDWVASWTMSYTLGWSTVWMLQISRDSDLDRSIKWCLSEAIFEKKCWSATDVLNYYNQTKNNYGIS